MHVVRQRGVLLVALFLAQACSRADPGRSAFLDRDFASYCEAFESLVRLSLQYHLTRTPDEYEGLRKKTAALLAADLKKDPPAEGTEGCADIESLRSADREDKVLYQRASQLFVNQLDPHSAYLSPEDTGRWVRGMRNQRWGIGAEFRKTVLDPWLPPRELTVEEVFPGSPVWGVLKPGDRVRIVLVADQEPGEISLNGLIRMSETGHPVQFELTDTSERYAASPSWFTWSAVMGLQLERGGQRFLYLKIREFTEGLADKIASIVRGYEKDSQVDAFVLDLRGNGGGILTEAVKLADVFLDPGLVVATSGNPDKTYPEGIDVFREYRADVPGTVTGKPVAILVDSGTASAAELFAGAVWNSAFVIGDRTYGKGIGQTQMPIGERTNGLGGSLILTTFRYRFPDGYAPQGRGISPHVLEPDPQLPPLLARRDSEGMKTFLREEDFGPEGIPSDGSSRDPKPAGQLRDLVERLEEDPPDLDGACTQTADCQLERALAYVERFAAMERGVDRQARSF